MWVGKARAKGPAVKMVSVVVTTEDAVSGEYTFAPDEVLNVYICIGDDLVALQPQIQKDVLVYMPLTYFEDIMDAYSEYVASVKTKGGKIDQTQNGFVPVFWNEVPTPVVIHDEL